MSHPDRQDAQMQAWLDAHPAEPTEWDKRTNDLARDVPDWLQIKTELGRDY